MGVHSPKEGEYKPKDDELPYYSDSKSVAPQGQKLIRLNMSSR